MTLFNTTTEFDRNITRSKSKALKSWLNMRLGQVVCSSSPSNQHLRNEHVNQMTLDLLPAQVQETIKELRALKAFVLLSNYELLSDLRCFLPTRTLAVLRI